MMRASLLFSSIETLRCRLSGSGMSDITEESSTIPNCDITVSRVALEAVAVRPKNVLIPSFSLKV